jgi:hypothetical protein
MIQPDKLILKADVGLEKGSIHDPTYSTLTIQNNIELKYHVSMITLRVSFSCYHHFGEDNIERILHELVRRINAGENYDPSTT